MRRSQEGRAVTRVAAAVVLTLAGVLAGCAGDTVPPAPTAPQASVSGARLRRHDWKTASASELFAYAARTDSTVVVGLAAPGTRRGVDGRGVVTLGQHQWAQAAQAAVTVEGATQLARDTIQPVLLMKVRDSLAVARLRALPFVEYVEPDRYIAPLGQTVWSSGSIGCGSSSVSGGASTWVDTPPVKVTYTLGGDLMSWNYTQRYLQVQDAWRRSQGAGVTVGLIDTGIDFMQPELTTDFASGQSTGRTIAMGWTYPTSFLNAPLWADDCSHGTHLSGVIAAPRNGTGTVGIAYKANFVGIRHNGDVVQLDAWNTVQAIDLAVGGGAHIINMAFKAIDSQSMLANRIRYYYNTGNVLFTAAAGTSFWGDPSLNNVLFPAEMLEVVAVTAVNESDQLESDSHYGPQVELAAYDDMPTTGDLAIGDSPIAETGQTSNASAIVAGIAALVWSRFPSMTNYQVRQQLSTGGIYYPNRHSDVGYGPVNAHKALGGLWNINLSACTDRSGVCNFYYKLQQCTTYSYSVSPMGGTGPFTYWWSTGDTGTNASMTLCPTDGRLENYAIESSITDNSDGTTITKLIKIQVQYAGPGACPTCPQSRPSTPVVGVQKKNQVS